ncbi:ADOP family duplicated permease [Tahibacter soli]|uniref:ADOP family duplicated permease n=1 Tax=Tahibacter soli TaxID=2983605 RepID=A0A9X3YQL5_9GAMM|nr:ADOP family duplicated permease [Tahibacter soli]MDC8016142.1 ADOP family duplicated permease [Tahibacter soli]
MLPLELRNTWRRLARKPGYSLLSIAVLGVGLGAVLFLFGLVNGLVLEPMPFPHADRLVAIGYAQPKNVGVDNMSSDEYAAIDGRLDTLELTGIYNETGVDLVSDRGARHYPGCEISQNMLPLLGVQPLLGRNFSAEDMRAGAALSVLIGERLWRDVFGASQDVVGRAIRVNGEPASVVGVLPGDFAFPSDSQVWLPTRLRTGDAFDVDVVARLAPGATLSQARAALDNLAESLGNDLAGQRAGRELTMKPLSLIFVNERTRSYVWLMFAAGVLVLLLACSNVANLQLGQTLDRQRELAVRSALGASRGRLLREQLLESLLLALGATVVALAIQQLGASWIRDVFAANGKAPPYFVHLGLDWRLFLFALVAAVSSTALVGMAPAWRASRTDVHDDLRDGAKGSRGGAFARLAKGVVVVEIVLTVILLIGAGTFIRGLNRMLATNVGSQADASHILTASITLFPSQYPDAESQARLVDGLGQRLRAEADVEAATIGNTIPGARLGSHEFVAALGQPRPPNGYAIAQMGTVDDHFASTYGLPLTAGRFFDARDLFDGADVVVVEKTLADLLWPGRDPLGQQLVLHPQAEKPRTLNVIGVIASMQLDGAMQASLPSMLVSTRQFPLRSATIAVRTRASATAFVPRLESLVAGVDAQTPVYATFTQARAIEMSRISAVVLTQVFTFVGLVALLLAAAGLYGMLSFSVAQRTREFGIRRAVGAGAGAITACVARQLLWQVVIGLTIGIGLSLPWSNVLADPKLQTRGHEGGVFFVVIAVVVVVAFLSALLPLYRALRVDPVVALRYE